MTAVCTGFGRCVLVALALLGSAAQAEEKDACAPGEQALKADWRRCAP